MNLFFWCSILKADQSIYTNDIDERNIATVKNFT